MPRTTFELTIRHLPDGSLSADARLTSAASAAAATLASGVPVVLDEAALLAASGDPAAYGTLLGDQLFTDPRLRDAWLKARAYAATGDLQLRLNLDAGDAPLHALRWETLRDPESGQPIALHERVRLVRALDSADLTPVVIPPRPDLRALVVVANPSNLADFGLAEVDVDGEVGCARTALGDIPTTILGDHPDRRATLANVAAALRDASLLVILVAHGTTADGVPFLWLEQEDGTADQVAGDAFVEAVARPTVRPLLFILASCRSAGGSYGDTLSALGPQLASIGVPAVLAFQGAVAMSTVKTLLPTLITELRRDGQIDRALASARAALGERRPWWQAVLWLRTDGKLWQDSSLSLAVIERRNLLEKEREELRNIINLFNRAVFYAPFPDEDPFEMLYALRQTRIYLQTSKATTFRDRNIRADFQEIQRILLEIDSQMRKQFPAIVQAIPRQPYQKINEALRQKARNTMGQGYWDAVRLMMNVRGEIYTKLESARRRLDEINDVLG